MDESTWRPVGDQVGAGGFWSIVAVIGPALCAALLLFLIVRAVARHGRYRLVGSFGAEDRRAVVEAVVEAERNTVGEILPVIVERSDPHPGAGWMAALCFVLVGSTLLVTWLPWQRPLLLLLAQLSMGALGFGLTKWLPDFKRVFVFEDRATEVAGEQAFQEFYANELHRTDAATGVLMFVSLFERRVIVLADKGIDSKVDAESWAHTDNLVLEGIRSGSVRDGLIAGIRRAGELLAENFPWKEGDRNEIPDRVIVRRE